MRLALSTRGLNNTAQEGDPTIQRSKQLGHRPRQLTLT